DLYSGQGVIGWLIGYFTGLGIPAVAIALGISLALSVFSYYRSDRIVLAISRARPADRAVHARYMNIVEGLSIAAGIPKPRAYVIDDPAPNAFATGRNPENAAVAITTGLMERMNRVELEGVIAHELAHIRNYDILVTTIAVVLAGVVVLLSDWLLRALWWGGRRSRDGAAPVALVLGLVGLVLALLSPLIAQLIKAAVSRRRETLADFTAVEFTRYPPGLISALGKLRDDTTVVRTASHATAHLWIESPLQREGRGVGNWINRLFDTHPPLDERIRALEGL
ncbi:MAG: M48 family metallopeptidase, partial [Actinomycetota bacterium]